MKLQPVPPLDLFLSVNALPWLGLHRPVPVARRSGIAACEGAFLYRARWSVSRLRSSIPQFFIYLPEKTRA